jgi:predicted nicotinamide N-methyase
MDDLVEHVIALPGREVALLAPRDGEALLSEEAFEQEEFLPYWAELWPSAMALARAIARRPLTGRRVIELGCGLGLPSIAAALAGGRVLATDWSPDSVAITARNAERNDAPLATAVYRWDAPPEPLGAPWPLVLASDVLYERRNVPPLLALLPRLTAASGEVWLADPGRAPAAGFLEEAARLWRIDAIPHDGPGHVTIHRLRARLGPGGGAGSDPPPSMPPLTFPDARATAPGTP